jgi:hypothetical protein
MYVDFDESKSIVENIINKKNYSTRKKNFENRRRI